MKKYRKMVSLTALLSFVCLIMTSIILYIVPAGRVAYWSAWHLWGMSKTEWGRIHINLGVLFLIAMLLHVYLNWSPIVSYLKNKTKNIRIFTKDFNLAIAVTAVVILGTYWMVPPFSTVINTSEAIKDAGSAKFGEPPYGHAELSSLQLFVKRMGWNLDEVLEKLAAAGIQAADPKMQLIEIAAKNSLTPHQVYIAMQPDGQNDPQGEMPAEHPSGLGKILLADFCKNYQLEPAEIIQSLKEKNISSQADKTMKAIAEQNQISPSDLYYMIKEIAGGLAR